MEKHGFKLEKSKRLIRLTNIDRTDNKGGRITYKIEYNVVMT